MSRAQVEQALTHRKLIAHWCARHGVALHISPDGNLWRWTHEDGKRFAEWWVVRGKLAFCGKYKRAVEVPGAIEACKMVEARWYPPAAELRIELDSANAPGEFTTLHNADLTGDLQRG